MKTGLLSIIQLVAMPTLTVGLLTSLVFAEAKPYERDHRAQRVERTSPADPRVTVSACTLSGNFTVRGWDRNEVRVRVSDGVDIDLARVDQTKSQSATELKLISKGRHEMRGSSCLTSADIEMDVPRAGGINIQTTNGDISVTGIGQLRAVTISGSITVANIQGEINASTIGGELSVRDSSGSFKLSSTGGSIDARDLKPLSAGDAVSASTVSGEVKLTHVQHERVSVNSVSGEATYVGALPRNGNYSVHSLSGEVRLIIPAASSFRLTAMVGESVKITSDFNLKYSENQNPSGAGNHGAPRHLSATVGSGDASVHVQLLNGGLRISKQ